MISAASSPPDDCWSESIEAIIRNCLDINYSLLARRAHGWTKADRALRQTVIDKVESTVSDDRQTGFGTAFPDFVRCVIQPTGGNFHTRMHNSNGKQIITALLVASLGNCLPFKKSYRGMYHCRSSNKFFSIEMTTHTKGQPHSDPTQNKYTGDVVMMGCCTTTALDAVQWLIDDSPRTPKLLVADTEASVDGNAIAKKVTCMRAVMLAYFVGVTPLLGVVVGGDLVVHALLISPEESDITEYAPLEGKDLTIVTDVVEVMKELNAYFHCHSISMTAEMRSNLPANRLRSSSVVSTPSGSSRHGYNLWSTSQHS